MRTEFYKIYDEFNEYYYTSANNNVLANLPGTEIDGETFIARPIDRSEVEIDNLEKDSFKFEAPISMQPLDQFVVFNPDRIFWLKVFNDEGVILYIGQIDDIKYTVDKHKVQVMCSSIVNVFSNNIPKNKFSPSCNFNLYDNNCTKNREDYLETVDNTNYTIDGVYQVSITTIKDSGYYSSGTLHINNQINFIKKHEGNIFYLLYPIKEQDFNGDILIYPGCNKGLTTCKDKFDNIDNFGGYPFVPNYNPYSRF